jgi:hypothetical protein
MHGTVKWRSLVVVLEVVTPTLHFRVDFSQPQGILSNTLDATIGTSSSSPSEPFCKNRNIVEQSAFRVADGAQDSLPDDSYLTDDA